MLMQPVLETDNFVQRCVELSENVDNYINNRLYLADVEDPGLVTPLFLKMQCLDILLDELHDRGIHFQHNAYEFIELLYDRELPFQLRSRFQESFFYPLIRKFSDESKQLLLNEFDNADDQLCARLCTVLGSILPMDAAWDYIASASDIFNSDETFRKQVYSWISRAIKDPTTEVPVESDLSRMSKWLAGEKKHQDELTRLLVRTTERLYLSAGDNESSTPMKLALLEKMERYDWDHFNNAFITKMMTNPKAEEEDEPFHQQHNDHHIQYYFQHDGITETQIIYVACTAASKDKGNDLREILKTNQPKMSEEQKTEMLHVLEVAETIWKEEQRNNENGNTQQ